MVLCFRFVSKTLLNILSVPTYQASSASYTSGNGQEGGRGHRWDTDSTNQRKGYSRTYGSMLSGKSKEKKEEGTTLMEWRRKGPWSGVWCLSSHVTIRPEVGMLSWRWLNTRLPKQTVNSFICFDACTAFAVPITLSLAQPTSFLVFLLLLFFFSSIPLWRDGGGGVLCEGAALGPYLIIAVKHPHRVTCIRHVSKETYLPIWYKKRELIWILCFINKQI